MKPKRLYDRTGPFSDQAHTFTGARGQEPVKCRNKRDLMYSIIEAASTHPVDFGADGLVSRRLGQVIDCAALAQNIIRRIEEEAGERTPS